MARRPEYHVWLPPVLTIAIWFLVVFAVAALVSKTWADLVGLFYLVASPLVYRSLARPLDGRRSRRDVESVVR